MHKNTSHNLWRLAWAAYLLVLCIASLSPLALPQTVPNEDKYMHFLAYAVLALLWPAKKGRELRVVLYASAIGVLLEIGQGVLPINRFMDAWDALANASGAALGMISFAFFWVGARKVHDGRLS